MEDFGIIVATQGSPPVRAWFAKRVVVVGAESTGTTTLARDLARALKTVWVPECGREYTAVGSSDKLGGSGHGSLQRGDAWFSNDSNQSRPDPKLGEVEPGDGAPGYPASTVFG